MAQKIRQTVQEMKVRDQQLRELQGKLAAQKVEALLAGAKQVCGVKIIAAALANTTPDALRTMSDTIKAMMPDAVAVLAGMQESKGTVTFAACCGSEAVKKGAHAGNLVREVAKIAGGSGGGRPDSAMAGGKDLTKVDTALLQVDDILQAQLKK